MRTMSIVVVTAMTKKKNNFQRWLEPYQECRNKRLKNQIHERKCSFMKTDRGRAKLNI